MKVQKCEHNTHLLFRLGKEATATITCVQTGEVCDVSSQVFRSAEQKWLEMNGTKEEQRSETR